MVATTLPPVVETTDLPNDISTPAVLLPDQALEGSIDGSIGDRGDFIRIDLEQGVEYRFDLDADPAAFFDTYLYLHDSTGAQVRANDDGGTGLNSRIFFTAPTSDTYYLRASFFTNWNSGSQRSGDYTLSVAEFIPVNFLGTVADETVTGGAADDRIETLGGNDSIIGGDGRDYLDGGSGDDTIESSGRYGTIIGGTGNDLITPGDGGRTYAGEGHDTILLSIQDGVVYGGDGDDTISHDGTGNSSFHDVYGGTGRDFLDFGGIGGNADLYGGAHDDVIIASDGDASGQSGNDRVHFTGADTGYFRGYGNEGDDVLSVEVLPRGPGQIGYARGLLYGGEGNDRIRVFTEGAEGWIEAYGEAGNDTLIGADMREWLSGGEGDDSIEAGGWADTLYGGEGSDTIRGGRGNDTADGAEGDDTVTGEQGNDFISGGDGDDLVRGNVGDDTVWGDGGNDRVEGGFDDDLLGGGAGDDTVYGQTGDDTLYGGAGNDVLYGGDGADTLWGVTGADTLDGGGGADLLRAGPDGDVMFGGGGDDTMVGDSGDDTFVFSAGADVAQDFDIAADILDLGGAAGITDMTDLMANHVSTVGGNAVITDADGDSLTLLVVTEAELGTATITF